MPRKSRDTVVREVNSRVDQIVAENRRLERLITGVLLLQVVVGLGLVVAGAVLGRWEVAAPGGGLAALLYWPIRILVALQDKNDRLRLVPDLLRLAEESEARRLAAEHVARIIEGTGRL
ncbi:MAG: hypothetical protein K2X87_24860 [Gemmataceae bacterium]|nr:hypothetical protein [Gemmataceae bacterium]